ncbi:MAG: hypothetical protein IIY71_04655 [Oscillospiraceae bacterium]|nr:hypothetical protein [Oscillospiraceae bacterium]
MKARFFLNYDFTFLAMLLDREACLHADSMCRCIASPFRRRRVCAVTPGFEIAADASVILSFWKLKDTILDEVWFRRLKARVLSLLLRPAYQRAAKRLADFDCVVRQCLAELHTLEQEHCPSLDRTADTFAKLLQAAGAQLHMQEEKRPVEQILYHVGRWIYLADAYDDLKEDFKRKRYNPLIARFGLKEPELAQGDRHLLEATMRHSLNLAASAYSLLTTGRWSEILDNILYLSLPNANLRVLSGEAIQWKQIEQKNRRMIYE